MRKRRATDTVRDELVRVRAGRTCDRRAEAAGLLRAAGTLHVGSGGVLAFDASTEHPGVARRIYEDLRFAVGAPGEVRLLEPGRGHPRQRYVVHVGDVGLQRLVEAGLLDDAGTPAQAVPRRIVSKRCCVAAYLRGAFLARGSVGDPRDAAHLEIRADSRARAQELSELLARVEVEARVREHRGWSAYVKRVDEVGTALAAMGAHDAYLRWESSVVLKGVHVEAARLANADAANARRLARAAVRHLDAIDALEASRGLEDLPRALREVAQVRRAYPQASLDELARLCDPPITKAAAADRLRRLEHAAWHTGERARR